MCLLRKLDLLVKPEEDEEINGVRGVDFLFIKKTHPLVLSVLRALLLASGDMALSKLKTLGTGLRRYDGVL